MNLKDYKKKALQDPEFREEYYSNGILIGKYHLRYGYPAGHPNEHDVWIEDTDTGEGGSFPKDALEEVINLFYTENF